MFTAKYLSLYFVLISFISRRFAVELIDSNTLDQSQYQVIEKVAFQINARNISGGLVEYKTTNLLHASLNGNFPRAEFAMEREGNSGFLTRYYTEDVEEKDRWDARLEAAQRFKPYNQDSNNDPLEEMISNNLYYSGMLFINMENWYIMSTFHTGGFRTLNSMISGDSSFVTFMGSLNNRLYFYLDLVRIWKILTQNLKMRICLASPYDITVRIPEGSNPTYRPIFRFPEFAVSLNQPCEDFVRNYTSKSVIVNDLESTEAYQKGIEVFSIGRLIYFVEVIIAYHVYERPTGKKEFLKTYKDNEKLIHNERSAKSYKTDSMLAAHQGYRAQIKEFREASPPFEADQTDANEAVNTAMEGLFDLVDTMVRENSLFNGRPNFGTIEQTLKEKLALITPFYGGRRMLLI